MLSIILLAGGSSSRFSPLKEKNLYPFLGRSFVEWQLERYVAIKPRDLIVVANEENIAEIDSVIRAKNYDAKVVVQKGDGQAGAVSTAIEHLSSSEDVLIINMNDVSEEILLKSFLEKLESLRSNKTNLLTGYYTDTYFPGGYLVLNDEGNVIEVKEKPGAGNEPSKYVRLVFDYFHSVAELKSALEKASSSKDDVYETALADMMKAGNKFFMLNYSGVWKTIKYHWHVLDVMEYYLSTITAPSISSSATIAKTAVIKGNVIIEDNVKVFDGAVINGPAYIGNNCIIANNALVRSSIIGNDCVVGFASEVARSYLRDNVWLHMNYIGDSVIESNVSFGSTSLTANFRLDEQNVKVLVKGEKVDSQKNKVGAIIGSNVRIGTGVNIMPGITIGSNSFVSSGILLERDVAAGSFVKLKQELVVKENNFDISKTNRDEIKSKIK
ncbi:MAG: sugar phosphate nucleotidyltransferase [Candidatus Dojkabacteria bacterium]|nr:MAG: sugar phosphate nucleotidyltransferase [Candidatus Dojkabacteria bacterium]